jgi:uncharacterized phage protein (TIGR01671 family)
MREIKFRGKRIDNGEWVYGSLLNDFGGDRWIVNTTQDIKNANTENVWHKVNPDTVGQYTGLKDKNGKEIYEGDITQDVDTGKTFEIMYQGHMFMRYERKPMYMFYTLDGDCLEVIGNIYENPELIGERHEN